MQDYNFTIRETSQLPKEENYILIFEMDCINIPHKITESNVLKAPRVFELYQHPKDDYLKP